MHSRTAPRSATRVTAALLAIALPTALRAQRTATPAAAGPRFGIMAGLSSATIGGSGATLDPSSGLEKKRRNGVAAGAYLVFPLAGLPLAVRPELLYAQKGLRATGTFYPPSVQNQPSVAVDVTDRSKLDYLELPVLLQLGVPNTAGLRPSLYAGPSVAYLLRCRVEEEVGSSTTSTTSTACGDQGPAPRKFDVSGVVGGQLGFALGNQSLGLGVRYTHGFTKLDKTVDVKNRAFAVYGAVEFGR